LCIGLFIVWNIYGGMVLVIYICMCICVIYFYIDKFNICLCISYIIDNFVYVFILISIDALSICVSWDLEFSDILGYVINCSL